MEIQRVKFLLLASALAAPACVTTVTDETAGTGGAGGSSGSATGGAHNGTGGKSTGGSSTGGSTTGGNPSTGGSSGHDGSVGGSDASTGGTDGSAGGDASTKDARTDAPISDGAIPIDVNRPDSGPCDDDTMLPGGYGNCDLLAADACAYASFQTSQCGDAKTTMKAFIGQQAIACMLANAALCEPQKTYDCKKAILQLACPDPTADTDCATIHSSCSTAAVDECKSYLNGLTAAGRAKMVSCMAQHCSFGLYSCVESL